MIIPIHFRVHYKNYPYAPKAKGASMRLGYLFTWPVLLILAFFWMAILAALLESLRLVSYDMAMGIAFVSLFPIGFALFKWKKRKEAKFDQAAILETQFMLSMTPEARRQYDEKLKKDARRVLWMFLGGILLFFILVFITIEVF